MQTGRVLIVEDVEQERTGLAEIVSGWGYETRATADGLAALEAIASWSPTVVISGLQMPRMGGIELLCRLKGDTETIAFIVVTAQGTIEDAVQAIRIGAYDYITKPIDFNRLQTILQNASQRHDDKIEKEVMRRRLRDSGSLGSLVGCSRPMKELFRLVEMIAPSTASVLITGESGTGKELAARAIHELSPRRNRPFVAINCAAIPETLIESEIFGHERGAFTGAMERRIGCFELAEGGTLLLDEIGEMPVATQAKLLRVLEDRKVRRLGSKTEAAVDVRVLAATNKIPQQAIAEGQLRSDLYYRLRVFDLHMPPLRERMDDVPLLIDTLLYEMNRKHSRQVAGVSEAAKRALQLHNWPGNVRELRNALERAIIVCEGGLIEPRHLPPDFGEANPWHTAGDASAVHLTVGTTVSEAERLIILKTLEATRNNKTRAAEILQISLKTLHNKLKEYAQGGTSLEGAKLSSRGIWRGAALF